MPETVTRWRSRSLILLTAALLGGCVADVGSRIPNPDANWPTPPPDPTDTGVPVEQTDTGHTGEEDVPDLSHWPDLAPYQERRPTVLEVTPASGRTRGGETVVVHGSGFIHSREVRFGDVKATSFQVQGPDRIQVVTPPMETPGPVNVQVATEQAVGVLADGFRYTNNLRLDSIEPAWAPVTGGVSARFVGSGFAEGVMVLVGAGRAWDLRIEDDGHFTAQLPPNPAGLADVWLFSRNEHVVLRGGLTYQELPRIDSVQPIAGPLAGGTAVELSGVGFGPAAEVTVGSKTTRGVVDATGTRLRFVTPPAIRPGAVDLLVRTSGGEAIRPAGFVYLNATAEPTLLAVTPDRGPTTGGNQVLLIGEGFQAGVLVFFDRELARCRTLDTHQLECISPPHPAGPIDVTIKQPTGPRLQLAAGYRYFPAINLTRISPDEGPETGGVAVELSGEGFAEPAMVLFGAVPARSVRVHPGGRRLSCIVPPGSAGPVDITVVQGETRATLTAGFQYQGQLRLLAVDPPQGSLAGNTLVRIMGTGFQPGMMVLFGQQPATDTVVESPNRMTVRTPRAEEESLVDLQIPGEAILPDAFGFYDPYTRSGGMWGGPIRGSVNLAVHDSYTGDPVVGALVLLGSDPASPRQGLTDERGLVTISTADLTGPVDIHAGAQQYEPASFLHTNGSNGTFFIIPLNPPPTPGGGPGELEEVDGTITGFLAGLEKYILEPRDPDWKRIAYVETTQDGIYGGNPLPGEGGTLHEDGPYTITARPGDLAVIAIAGLLNTRTYEFRPMRLGVHRYLFMPIRGFLEDIDIVLDIELNHQVGVRLLDPPYDFDRGPDELSMRSWLEFKPEGFYQPHNEVKGSQREFWVEGLPEADQQRLDGVILHFETGLYTKNSRPYSIVWTGSIPLETEFLEVGPFVGIPHMLQPTGTNPLGADYFFTWTIPAGVEPDVYSIRMLGPTLTTAWRIILPGPQRSFVLPNIPELFTVPEGRSFLAITAGRAPVFSMDAFEYRHLSVRAWDSWSLDYVDFLNPPPPAP